MTTATSEVSALKRKVEASTSTETTTGPIDLEASFKFMRSTLKSATNFTKIESVKNNSPSLHRIAALLADLGKVLDGLLTKRGILVSPVTSTTQKKSKCKEAEQTCPRPTMIDASTDTILTPNWWDSDAIFEEESKKKRRNVRKPQETVKSQELGQAKETEAESAMDTDTATPWSNVVKRGPRRRNTVTDPRPPAATAPQMPPAHKPKPSAKQLKPPSSS